MEEQIIHKDKTTFTKKPNLSDYKKAYKSFSWKKASKEELTFFKDGSLNAADIAIDRHAKGKTGEKTAILFESISGHKKSYSYKKLQKETNKFANVLSSLGVQKGDRVFIFLPPVPERYIAFFGILKIGAIAGTLFSAFMEMALMDRLSDSTAKIIITNPSLFPRIQKIWKDLPHLKKVIIVEDETTQVEKNQNIIFYQKEMDKANDNFAVVHLTKDDFAYMLYTSGTTGKPKGVIHVHGDILQAIITTKYVLDVHNDDIYWCTADLGWVTGVVYGALGIFGMGGTSVIYEGRFSPENWYNVLQKYKVTVWYTAPTAIRLLMGSSVSPKDYDFSHLRFLASVGEPLNPEVVWWGLKAFGLPFHDSWWQTEQGSITITNYAVMDIKPGSMGKPLPGIIAAVINDQGEEVPIGEEGNLALKPETVNSLMKEIWGNKEKFKSYFSHGWYLSGDRAYKDKDGYFWFVGRADDVIKTSGERVGPFEVESALVEHPDVIEAGVIGKPDEVRGEIIKAFIVVKPEVPKTEETKKHIMQFVKQHLAAHAYPREIEFIEKLPKTRSGKIMRRLLKAHELGLAEGDTSTLEEY